MFWCIFGTILSIWVSSHGACAPVPSMTTPVVSLLAQYCWWLLGVWTRTTAPLVAPLTFFHSLTRVVPVDLVVQSLSLTSLSEAFDPVLRTSPPTSRLAIAASPVCTDYNLLFPSPVLQSRGLQNLAKWSGAQFNWGTFWAWKKHLAAIREAALNRVWTGLRNTWFLTTVVNV